MKYYVREHTTGYKQLQIEGKTSWDELHGSQSFEDAAVLPFIAAAMHWLPTYTNTPQALEYGCGTGPGACFLAANGMEMDGIDLNPTAIEIAKREATKRRLTIHYAVGDVCQLPVKGKKYDLIADSFCLQSIVTDDDRRKLFAFVRGRLRPKGHYFIATAGFSATRLYEDSHFDAEMGIVYQPIDDEPEKYEDVVQLNGRWYSPHRRHLSLGQLANELAQAGFQVTWHCQDASNGNLGLICTRV